MNLTEQTDVNSTELHITKWNEYLAGHTSLALEQLVYHDDFFDCDSALCALSTI